MKTDFIHSKVFRNGLWLTLLQLFNTLAPMLTIPYITRVLGASKYGTFSIALNLIYYIQVIVEYGFDMSGARRVALNNDSSELNSIYTSILTCRIILSIVSIIVLIGFAIFGNYDRITIICMSILIIIVIGTTIQLTWLFQGMQDMKPITVFSMTSRVITLILIFVFVKSERELYLYCLLYSLTNIVFGIACQFLARKKYHIKLVRINMSNVVEELKDGWYLFTSSAMAKIFGNVGVTILGLVTIDYEVGVYSAITKITSGAILLFLPISQAMFPYVSQLFASSETEARSLIRKVGVLTVLVFSVGSTIVFMFRDSVVRIAFGEEYVPYSMLLLPLIIWMMFSIINNFMGIQTLVASGRQKEYSYSFSLSMLFLIGYNLLFINAFKMYGAAIAQAASEITLFIILAVNVIRSFEKRETSK